MMVNYAYSSYQLTTTASQYAALLSVDDALLVHSSIHYITRKGPSIEFFLLLAGECRIGN